jgi:type I restriction enzyme S subunit
MEAISRGLSRESLHGGAVNASEERITETGLQSSSAKLLRPGTVLVAMYGATAGVVAELGMEAATNQAICALVPSDAIRGPFLLWALRASMPQLMQRRVGGAQPNLTQAAIREHLVPVPPVDMQDRFAAVHRATQEVRRRSAEHLAHLDALFASLQHRAFIGEL